MKGIYRERVKNRRIDQEGSSNFLAGTSSIAKACRHLKIIQGLFSLEAGKHSEPARREPKVRSVFSIVAGIICLFLLTCAFGCQRSNREEPLVGIQIQDRNGLTETVSTPDRLQIYDQVDFLSSQPYKKVLRVYKKDGKSQAKITTYYPNGSIWRYLETQEMRAFGAYQEWHENGQIRIDATVIGGTADVSQGSQHDWLFDGLSRVWDEQGNLIAKISYQKGLLDGTSTYYFPSGQIEKEIPYIKNSIEGEFLEFSSNGKLKSITKYKKGLKVGPSNGYFPDGKISWEEEYSDNLLLNGLYYNPSGEVCSEIKNGGGFQAIFEEGLLSFLVEYRYGHPEGRIQKYLPSGEAHSFYHLKNGKKHGEEVEFYLLRDRTDGGTQPLPKLSVQWFENAIHGKVKTWYSNGQLQSERDFCRNQKRGSSLAWYKEGSIMLIEEYDEDRLVRGQYFKLNQRDPISTVNNGTGIATLFDEQGFLARKVNYSKGKPVDPEN